MGNVYNSFSPLVPREKDQLLSIKSILFLFKEMLVTETYYFVVHNQRGHAKPVTRGLSQLNDLSATVFPPQKQVMSKDAYSLKVRLLYYETSSKCDKQ